MYSSPRLPAAYRDVGFLLAARVQEKRLWLVASRDPRREAAVFLDGCLRQLSLQESRCRRALGRLLDRFRKKQAFVNLGFVRLGDWSRERLGISGSEAETMARVISRLERLPLVSRSFDAGEISWTKARILAAAATEETEERWLEVARTATVRELEKIIREGAGNDRGMPLAASEARARSEVDSIREDDGEEIEGEPRVRFRMSCSGPVWLLFRRVVELARRMSGSEVPVWRAVDAIAAEGISGAPRDPFCEDVRFDALPASRRAGTSVRSALSYGVLCPSDAPVETRTAELSNVAALFGAREQELREAIPEEIEVVASDDAHHLDPFELDRLMRAIVRTLQAIDWRTGRLLDLLATNRLEREVGFGSFEDYVRERLRMSLRKARALLSLARAKPGDGEIGEAYRDGRISWVRAMTLAPVARCGDGALAAAWVEHARRVMVRRLSDDVAWALETRAAAGAGAGLPEPPPLGPAAMRVQTRVEESGAGGSSDPGSAAFVVDFSAPASIAAMFRQAIVAWWNPGEPLWRGLERLLLHVSAEWERQGRKPDRILTRDGYRCLVPGCSSRRNLHVHHFTFRSAGGGNEPDNLGTACAAHHLRGIHAGRIRARGRAPDEILWELGVRPGKEPLIRLRGDVYVDAGSS